jgi:transposase
MNSIEKQVKILYPETSLEGYDIVADVLKIKLSCAKKSQGCGLCGKEISSVHSEYDKKFSDLPINKMFTEVLLTNKMFICRECLKVGTTATTAATYNWINLTNKKTDRLIKRILEETLVLSVRRASESLNEMHIKADPRTISRLTAANGMRKSDMV